MNKNVGYQWLVRMVNDILDGKNQGKIDVDDDLFSYLEKEQLASWISCLYPDSIKPEKHGGYLKEKRKRVDLKMEYAAKISEYIFSEKKRAFLVKGFVLSDSAYKTPYARDFGDVDFFCVKEDICSISKYIESLGFCNSTKSKMSQCVAFGERLSSIHFGNDNENEFHKSDDDVWAEAKTGDYFAHGGFDDRQTEMIFEDPAAIVNKEMNGHSFPVLNTEYTFLMLVSNTYRNFNTRSGQMIDFKIRDLVDLIFFLKANNVGCLTLPMRDLFIKFGKMYELCIVLKYADKVFETDYIKRFIRDSNLGGAVEAAELYTPIEETERFVCDTNYRTRRMEENLCARLKVHLQGKLPSEYVQSRYPVSTTRLFEEIYEQGLFICASHCERQVSFRFYFDRTKAKVPLILSFDVLNLSYREGSFKYATVIEITQDQIRFQSNPLNMDIREGGNTFILQGVIPEDCLYKGWMCFVAMGYYFGTEWTDYACRLAEPDKPACYYIGI